MSSLYHSSVIAQPGLCLTWSETPKTGFFWTQLRLRKGSDVSELFGKLIILEIIVINKQTSGSIECLSFPVDKSI